jgi:hypothetical protein
MSKAQNIIGSISSGTLRNEDLIPTFLNEIAYHTPSKARKINRDSDLVKILDAIGENDQIPEDLQEIASFILNEDIFDTLNEIAYKMPYCYFGAHPGNGSDFGFWVDWELIEMDIQDGDILAWNDDTRNPTHKELDGYSYYCKNNDHGNFSLYARNYKAILETV